MQENWSILTILIISASVMIATIEVIWRLVGEPRDWAHEIGRKTHHIGIGLFAAILPEYLLSRWTGFFLGLGFGIVLLLGFRFRFMRSLFDSRSKDQGGEAVRRWSITWIGPAAFSLAVAIIAYLFWDEKAIYRASILILTLGDSAATIFGILFGRHCYNLFGSRRSLEGNVALVVLASAVCLSVLPQRGLEAMLFAWMMGVFLCLAEAISPNGLDNLALPLAAAAALSILRTGPGQPLQVGPSSLLALGLVTLAAATFTASHIRPSLRNPAVLAMGTAFLLLAELGHMTAMGLMGAFIALTLGAELLTSDGSTRFRDGTVAGVLTQLIPSALFVLLSLITGNRNFFIGSLASLTVVARNCWGAMGPVSASRPAAPSVPRIAIESLSGMGGAWAALLMAGVAGVLFDLGRMEASLLAIVLASTAGGLACCVVQRYIGPPPPEGEPPLIQQFVPAVLALVAVPILSLLLLGISG